MRALILVTSFALALASTSCSDATLEPKNRPAGVPPNAKWAGGADGGAYIWCEFDAPRDVDRCAVWNDYTCQIVEQGDYRLLKEGRAATREELDFRWADFGGWIGLKDNKVLANLAKRHP
jgi:hypothetical protein